MKRKFQQLHTPQQARGPLKAARTLGMTPRYVTPEPTTCCAVEGEDPLLPGLPDHIATLCLARVSSPATLYGVSRSWQRLLYSCTHFRSTRAHLGYHASTWLYTLIAHHPDISPNAKVSFSWYAFDPLSATWHLLPPMPPDVRFELSRPGFLGPYSHSIQCASTGDKLIILAGTRAPADPSPPTSSPSKSIVEPALDCPVVFDVTRATWSRGPRYTVPRRWCICGVSGEKILVASGCGSEWDVDTARSAEVWDTSDVTATATWRPVSRLASTKLSREATSAVDVDGRLYMMSARNGAVFDTRSETWSATPYGMTRGWAGSCVAWGGRVLAVDDAAGRLKAYNAAVDDWEVVAEHEMLKGLGNVVVRNGKMCGGAGNGSGIRVFDLRGGGVEFVEELRLPIKGQVVGMQVLSGMVLDQ